MLQCPASESSLLPLMVSTLAVPDDLRHITSCGEEDWDPAYVIHLHPMATLRNLLPYTIRYMMEVTLTAPSRFSNSIIKSLCRYSHLFVRNVFYYFISQ